MSYPQCTHDLDQIGDIPAQSLLGSQERFACHECNSNEPYLFMCLHRDCLFIGCSGNTNSHITLHDTNNPSHSLYLNLSTLKILCTKCESEITMEMLQNLSGDSMVEEDLSGEHNSQNLEEKVAVLQNGTASGAVGDLNDNDEVHEMVVQKRFKGLIGLQNIGNTCYMNAALQALSNTKPLTNFFLECDTTVYLLSGDKKPGLSRQYQTLMKDIWVKKSGGYVVPSGILYGIRNVHAMFRGYHQHDTQEFLRNFMDQLHEELKQVCPPECAVADVENMCSTVDKPVLSTNYDTSEGEYETCDSGVSERSSLSDDTERTPSAAAKRRLSRSVSPGRRLRQRLQSSPVIDKQPKANQKKQLKQRSIISDIFDGKLLSSVQCLTCDRVSSRVETFQDLSLPIPSKEHLIVLHGRGTQAGIHCSDALVPMQEGWISWFLKWLRSWFYGPTVTLHDCLSAFFSTDELKGDNMYSCERCNYLRNGLKYSKVLQLPEVLCIHLKRFRHELMFSSKICSAVSFPLKGLDMRPYLHTDCVSQVTTYELFSVICHHGTAGAGHYTCFSLNNNQWFEFDDQCVTKVYPENVQNCEAYVLFYRKTLDDSLNVIEKARELQHEEALQQQHDDESLNEVAYVSKQWLSRFKTCAEPGPIDNSDFLCLHHYIIPQRREILDKLSIVIPKKVYDFLYKKFGGCPAITSAHVCPTCAAISKRILDESDEFRQLNIDFEYQIERPTHLISTEWFRQWKTFIEGRVNEAPGPIDNNCPQQTNGEEFIEINKDIWDFFYSIYGGGPEIVLPQPLAEEHHHHDEMVVHDASSLCPEEAATAVGLPSVDCLGKGEPMELDAEPQVEDRKVEHEEEEEVVEVPPAEMQSHQPSNSSNTSVQIASDDEVVMYGQSQPRRRRKKDVAAAATNLGMKR